MSLLMDALRQAEATRGGTLHPDATLPNIPAEDGLSLEPLTATANQTAPNKITEPTTPPRTARRGLYADNAPVDAPQNNTQASAAVREMLAVKQTPARSSWAVIIAVAGLVLLSIGAFYVWWQIEGAKAFRKRFNERPATYTSAPAAAQGTLAAPAVANQSSPASAPINTPGNFASVVVAPSMPTTAALPKGSAKAAENTQKPALSRRRTASITNLASQPPVLSIASETADATVPRFIKTPRQENAHAPSSSNQAAYAALQAGQFAQAQNLYESALRQDPRNVDAMNGLGVLAWRSGRSDTAEQWFRRANQLDPSDDAASTQLALLYSEGEPVQSESKLRQLVANRPNSANAYAALGALLSRQGRWADAQNALFQAYTLDNDNPDTLFNLAVSLEQLRQAPLARQFYERALLAAKTRAASFNRQTANTRLTQLGGAPSTP